MIIIVEIVKIRKTSETANGPFLFENGFGAGMYPSSSKSIPTYEIK